MDRDGHFPGKYTFSSNRDFPAYGSACRGIFDNRLEYQFVLNHLGTFLIFPWHSFDYQARFWHIMVQLVASNGAKLLSQLIANTTFNLSEIAWKHPFFPLSRVPRTCGRCVTQLRFSRCSGRRAGCCGWILVDMKSFPPEDMPNSVSSQHHYEQCLPFDFNNFMKQPELPLRVEIVSLWCIFLQKSRPWLIRVRLELVYWHLVLQNNLGNCCCQIREWKNVFHSILVTAKIK